MGKTKVLVVSGDKHYRGQLILALEEDFKLFEAEDRNTAIQYLEKEKGPDVILMELFLPPRPDYPDEGFTVLKKFKEIAPEVKVVVVTTIDRRDIIDKTRELGVDDYIVKPFSVEHLKNSIKKATSESIPKGIEKRRYRRDKDGTPMGIEKRRYRRVPCEVPISYSLLEGEFPVSGKSITVNMSSGGVMFPVDQVISKKQLIHLALALPIPPAINATGGGEMDK